MSLPANAFILAAGYGSRLRPLTETIPKPLLPCMGVPLIDIALHQLRTHGIQHIYINTHHRPDKFAHLSRPPQQLESRKKPQVTLLHEPTLLGSAGFVRNLNQLNTDLITYNGDIISDIDFAALYQTHRQRKAIATLALLPTARPNTHPVYVHNGHLIALEEGTRQEHPRASAHTFACAQVLSAEFLQLIAAHEFTHIKDAWQHALDHHYPIATFLHRGLWFDIGTPANFFRAHQALHQKLQHDHDFLHIATLLDDDLHLHHNHAIVGTPHIEKNCLIKAQTFITSSQVTIHAPAQLDHCVVMHGATVHNSYSHTLLLGNHALACG